MDSAEPSTHILAEPGARVLKVESGARGAAAIWPLVIAALLVGLTFAPLFIKYWREWTAPNSPFGYGYFVPPSVAIYLWCIRKKLTTAEIERPRPWVWPLLGLAIIVDCLGLLAGVTLVQGIAMLAILYSLCQVFWGAPRTRLIAPCPRTRWPSVRIRTAFYRRR